MTTARRYPGSRPFQDNDLDRLLFWGREQEKSTLLHLILAEDLVLLYAKSGMGKTSLLSAGILQQLRVKEYFPVLLRLNDPQRDPIVSIQEQLLEHASRWGLELEGEKQIQKHLWLFLHNVRLWKGNVLLTPVLIFDQFEELFTVNSDEQRRKFISHFAELARKYVPETLRGMGGSVPLEKPPPLKMVLSMREDYLGELEQVAAEVPQVINNRFRLKALTRESAEQAIREPAVATDAQLLGQSFTYQSEAIEAMLDFLCTRRERGGLVKGNEVEPFQLQILCQHLEEKVLEHQQKCAGPVIVHAGDLGGQEGMEKILQDLYNHQIAQFPAHDQDAVRWLCERGLVSDSERRLSLEEEDIERRYGVHKALLGRMVELRLLRAEPRVGSVYYELSHDTLVAPVLRERKERDHEAVFKMAETHRVKGNFQEAFATYERVVRLDNSYTFAYLRWADLLMEQGRADGATEVLKRAIEHGVEHGTVYHLLGKALAERGAYKEAIPYYCKALALELKDQLAAVHTDLGDAYRKDDEKAKAVESYQRALQLDRKNANIYRQLALLLTEAREFNQAVQVFQAAVEADPEFGYIFEDLVKELRLQGAHEVASEICHLSLAVESGNSSFFFRLGYVSGDLKDDKNAVDAYEKSARLNPNEPATYNNWGVALGNLGRHAEALEKYQRAVELDPGYAGVYGNWGRSLGALGRHTEALEKYQRAVELNPGYAWVYSNWGWSLGVLKRHAEALEKYRKVLELKPEDAQAYNNWGWNLGHLGQHAEALEKYQRAVELNPSYAWAYGNWGWSLGALERHAEALEKCQRAVELNPSYAWAYDNWGRSLDHLERHAEALEKYEKAGELNPSQRPPAKPKA